MKILVLDQDLMERTVIQQVLQYNGHEIVTAENSEIAMQILQEGEIRFVIADRVTTDIDEAQFIQRVRDAKPPYHIYILLITVKVRDGDITIPRSGADDYLSKPIVPLDLKTRVQLGERILGMGDNLTRARDTLQTMAMFDPLTNVLSQNAFMALSRGELERARRTQSPLSLIAVEIDNFGLIKEHYGRTVADDVLTVVAQGVREKSRPYDGLGRYAENSFLLILPGVIGQDAEKIAERILKGILNTEVSLLDGTPVNVRVSAGIASAVHVSISTEIEPLIEQANKALAHSKRAGGNQVYTVFD